MKTTYVDGAIAPLANTGQIKLHGPPAFAAMRKAGQLTAEALDLLCDHVRPGITTDTLTWGAFTRRSVMSASLKPFTANLAAL